MDLKLPADLDLHDLIGLISDPASMKAYLAKLEALSDEIMLQREINATLEQAQSLKLKALQDQRDVSVKLDATQAEVVQIRADAKQAAKDARAQMEVERTQLAAERASFATFHKLECDKLKAREDTCCAQERELAGAQERVAGKTAWAEKMISEYKEKLARLKEFAAQV